MTHQKIFDLLTRNAFDFLERAIEEFDQAPKYSVIHFCAAVEMLLKARLMKEHWSLILSKPDQANLAKFMAGDFISVTLEDARARIRDVAGEDIGNDAYNSFHALANHRNKMVHFFHDGLENDEKAKEQIVAEHCRSWFHLHRLLNRWKDYFHDFAAEIAHADRAMKGYRQYLTAKFKALKPELDAKRKAGKTLRACSACGFKATVYEDLKNQIPLVRCLVCGHSEVQVALECPYCGESIVVANEGYATCGYCREAIKPEHLVNILTDHATAYSAAMDGDDSWDLANCSNCEGYHTVVRRGDNYFCTSCFEICRQVEMCEWCNEPCTGDMEGSYVFGCNHCEGQLGWHKDD